MTVTRIVENNQTKWRNHADAEAVAKANRDGDPEWTYVAQQASDGWWYVAVFDEDGEGVGVM
ncbi:MULTISPECIES: hypothetical protein [unclassified Bradyrhizobium]|uniref:hypothetical protein n=1 Tax=unclassified Bradyrhizobium TaxID=2631580 RepID=UPI0004255917|nr:MULTISPECIES: hypothetical protein [unclassified Bradyrhizobium]MCK7669354.1 hypothetical protein [Bradyrhizobium sp. 2S1]